MKSLNIGNISIMLFLMFLMLLVPETIKAVTIEVTNSKEQICVGNQKYTITYDKKMVDGINSSKVEPSMITMKDIDASCYLQNGKCLGKEYKFQAVNSNIPCAITSGSIGDPNYSFSTCPLDKDKSSVTAMSEMNQHISSQWNGKVWVFTIKNAKGYKITNNDIAIAEPNADGVTTFTVAPGAKFYLKFYLNLKTSNACDGFYMGYVQGAASKMIDNPFYNGKVCSDYRAEVLRDNSVESNLVSSMIDICYKETISYDKVGKYSEQMIKDMIAKAKMSVPPLSIGTLTDRLQCSFDASKNSNTTNKVDAGNNALSASAQKYTQLLEGVGGTYWRAVCTETLEISYEQPKGVSAGQGFSYSPTIKMTRQCTPLQIKVVEKKDECSYSVECWGGPANHTGEPGAGPSADFDKCVEKCDGGKYSQSCIDKCYQENYESSTPKNVQSPLFGIGTLSKKDGKVTPMGYGDITNNTGRACSYFIGRPYAETRLPLSSCQVTLNNIGCISSTACMSEHGVIFTYLDACNSGNAPTKCYEVYTSNPDCVVNSEESYKRQIEASIKELQDVHNAISQYTNETNKDEKFSASIIDSYTGKVQEYKRATAAEVKVKSIKKEGQENDYTSTITATDKKEVGTIAGNIVEIKSYNVERSLQLSLDYGYVSKTAAFDTIYGNAYNSNNKDRYYAGEQKYFTHIKSNGINLYERWPTVLGVGHKDAINEFNGALKQNINYVFDKLGAWNQWTNVNLDCFYGIKSPPDGLDIIYRPIDLNSPFVDRDPRWNWSTDAINNKYNINPFKTIEDITTKGYGIYTTSNQTSEVSNPNLDYEIVLTKQNINEIRKYNKEKGGEYLNYDMYCYTKDGANVCRSELIGEIYSSDNQYMRILKRGNIGCNNQANVDQCERDYIDVRGSK